MANFIVQTFAFAAVGGAAAGVVRNELQNESQW